MKVGSIVECVGANRYAWMAIDIGPASGDILTVCGISNVGGRTYLHFDEYPIPSKRFERIGFVIEFFRELLPPGALEKEIRELLEDEVLANEKVETVA